jgi:hypothetical protein
MKIEPKKPKAGNTENFELFVTLSPGRNDCCIAIVNL